VNREQGFFEESHSMSKTSAVSRVASPPVLRPEDWEKQPTFRETFLLFVTDPGANATLRELGRLLRAFTLDFCGLWPSHPEGVFRAQLRAAIADLRHVEGAFGEWIAFSESPEETRLAAAVARATESLHEVADGLERALGPDGDEPAPGEEKPEVDMDEVYEILSRRYETGETDVAARHNELEP
jgi:hypothetical protein